MILEHLVRIRCQKHKFWFLNLKRVYSVLPKQERPNLLNDFKPILPRHLEVKQHQANRLYAVELVVTTLLNFSQVDLLGLLDGVVTIVRELTAV